MKKLISIVLICAMSMALVCQAFATDLQQTAAGYLRSEGILQGDQNGDLHLDANLTRAELSVMLTKMIGNQEHIQADKNFYLNQCDFTDVPDWAKLYVGYCNANRLMVGYGDGIFGAADSVTPAAACTVVLRYLELPKETWNYNTACQVAVEQGLTTNSVSTGVTITRGDLAVMLYRAMTGEKADIEKHGLTYNSDGSINIPSDGSRYMPQTGDVIRCDDGSNYTITNASRYDKNMFADGPVGPLPEPTCDWSLLEMPELPKAEARHITDEHGDYLFICNQFETLRMCYTLFNAIGSHPNTWENGRPKLNSKGIFPVHIHLTIPEGVNYDVFWPWRANQITDDFNSVQHGSYYFQVWDVFRNGVFLRTEYQMWRE